MKTWENSEVVELNISNTENGGTPSADFDQ